MAQVNIGASECAVVVSNRFERKSTNAVLFRRVCQIPALMSELAENMDTRKTGLIVAQMVIRNLLRDPATWKPEARSTPRVEETTNTSHASPTAIERICGCVACFNLINNHCSDDSELYLLNSLTFGRSVRPFNIHRVEDGTRLRYFQTNVDRLYDTIVKNPLLTDQAATAAVTDMFADQTQSVYTSLCGKHREVQACA